MSAFLGVYHRTSQPSTRPSKHQSLILYFKIGFVLAHMIPDLRKTDRSQPQECGKEHRAKHRRRQKALKPQCYQTWGI